MNTFNSIFNINVPVIGMIHLQASPGAPKYAGNVNGIIDHALSEMEIYLNAGINAIAIENMHDVPYLKNEIGHEVSSIMAIVGHEIKKASNIPCGIQILAASNKAALAVANSAGLDFIRAEGFVFGHVADEGYIDANAGELLRFRKNIGAEHIAIFTDIKKKHSAHAVTADVDIVETAKAADFFLSDGLIVTGSATGNPADVDELKNIKKHCSLPLIVGSGITLENVEYYFPFCDALIVGSYFKKNGNWANDLDPEKIKGFMGKINDLRK